MSDDQREKSKFFLSLRKKHHTTPPGPEKVPPDAPNLVERLKSFMSFKRPPPRQYRSLGSPSTGTLATEPTISQPESEGENRNPSSSFHANADDPNVQTTGSTFNDEQNKSEQPSSSLKNIAKAGASFTQLLLTRLPDFLEPNPVKLVFGLAQVVIEITKDVQGNMDSTDQRIASISTQLMAIQEELHNWETRDDTKDKVAAFGRSIQKELELLRELKAQSIIKQVALVEDNKGVLSDIFERVNEARIQLQLRAELRTLKIVDRIEDGIEVLLLDRLKPSDTACHDFYAEGEEHRTLRRVVCAPETRTRQLANITHWAKNSEGEDLYWLYGPAGAGKSTIAYTIARRFESRVDANDNIVLGGSFFCSRQFSEAKYATRIVQTLAYQLAAKCKPFGQTPATASKSFDVARHTVREQVKVLLVDPWQQSVHERDQHSPATSHYLLVIDALDELEGDGGYLFLCALVDAIQSRKLLGLKFLATSRPEPRLVSRIDSFATKEVFRLQDVPVEEARSDVNIYLQTSLPELSGTESLRQLAELAEGSFILAATVAKQILGGDYSPQEQLEVLSGLLDSLSRRQERLPVSPEGDTFALDKLYLQVLEDAFNKLDTKIRKKRVLILHTLLCSAEPISSITLAALINGYSEDRVDKGAVEKLIARLYSVLYVQGGSILFYHKSFPDFMLNEYRSGDLWWCDQPGIHQRLARGCFQIMSNELRFNIAGIPSSYILDRDNSALPASVNSRIPIPLSYACRNWDQHLCQSSLSGVNGFVEQIAEFLRVRVLFWIEVMNLLKMSDLCGRKLGGVREYIGDSSKELAQNLSEAASFATYFSSTPASASTPHLYISALATWPRDTPLSRNWRKHFPRIPTFTNPPLFMPLVTVQPNDIIRCFCFAENNQELIMGTDDGLRIWDIGRGTWSKRWSGHHSTLGEKAIRSVALSRAGDRICSGCNDGSMNVWDAASGSQVLALRGHEGPVESSRFVGADDSRIVSSSSVDVRIWDVSNGEQLKALDTRPFDPVRDWLKPDVPNAIPLDGHRVAAAHQWGVYLWDLHTEELLWVRHSTDRRDVCSLAISDDGVRVAAGLVRAVESQDAPGINVWTSDEAEAVFIRTIGEEGQGASVWDLRFLGDTRIAWTSASRAVGISDAVTGDVLISLTAPNSDIGATSISLTFDFSRMASRSPDGFIRVWDLWGIEGAITEQRRESEEKDKWQAVYACSQDCRFLASKSAELVVWDLPTGEGTKLRPADFDKPSWPTGPIAISQDGGLIALAGMGLFKSATKELLPIDFGSNIGTLTFSKDGNRLASLSRQLDTGETTILAFDVSDGRRLFDELRLPGDTRAVISKDGSLVVSISRAGVISRYGCDIVAGRWNPIGSARLEKFPKPTTESTPHFFTSVSLSGDGSRVVMSFTGDPPRMLRGLGKDNRWDRVHVWDVSSGRRLLSLHGGLEFQVNHNALALSDDGSLLVLGFVAAAFKGHAFEVWDVQQKKIIRTLGWGIHRWVPPGDVVYVTFSPDGDHLISGQASGVARLWSLRPLVYVRQRVGPDGASPVRPTSKEGGPQRDFEKEFEDSAMSGWLVSPAADPETRYLMYAPLHTRVPHSSLVRDLPSSFARIELEPAALGAEWTKCYERWQSLAL